MPEDAVGGDRLPVTITVAGEPVGFARNVSPRAVGGAIKYRPIPARQKNAFAAAILWPSPIAVPAWRISTRSGRGPIYLRNSSALPGNPPSAITTATALISTTLPSLRAVTPIT